MSAADPRNVPGSFVPCTEAVIGCGMDCCVHEHVHHFHVCAGCAAELQRAAPDLICPECEDSAESHQCLQMVVIRWTDGTPPTTVQEARVCLTPTR